MIGYGHNHQGIGAQPLARQDDDGAPLAAERGQRLHVVLATGCYVAAISGVEATVAFAGLIVGAICAAALILIMLNHAILTRQVALQRLLRALVLLPLLRLLSLTMPIPFLPQIYWHALIGLPLLLAITLTMRQLGISGADLGLRRYSWQQALIAASGLPLAAAAYALRAPAQAEMSSIDLLVAPLLLIGCAAFVEELLFRGLIQHLLHKLFPRTGLLIVTLLFAASALATRAPAYIAFVALVGLFYSWCVARSHALWGVIVSHSLLNIGALLLLPLLVGPAWAATPAYQGWALGASAVLVALIAALLAFVQARSARRASAAPEALAPSPQLAPALVATPLERASKPRHGHDKQPKHSKRKPSAAQPQKRKSSRRKRR